MYYRFDSEAQIMLISEEADYKECLKLVTLANSCYQDEYTKNELQKIQELGIESFDVDRKFLHAKIFDVYEGEHVEEGKKSIAISLRFQDPAKTLDEESITKAMHAILERVKKEFNAVIRQ